MTKTATPVAVPPELAARLARELAAHRDLTSKIPDPKKRRKAIIDILKLLDRLAHACRGKHSPYRLSPDAVIAPLVEILSAAGVERVLGIRVVVVAIRGDAQRQDDRGGSPIADHERRVKDQALSAALGHPIAFITGLIDEIRKPLVASLSLCGTPRGRPRDVERRHVVLEAKKAFEQITGQRASKNPSGPFVQFCSDLCDGLGIGETDTLCTFVAEVLYRPRRRRSRPKASRVANPSD